MIEQAAIIGLGLMGGSMGMALLKGGVAREVVGYDRQVRAVEMALEVGAISRGADGAAEAVQGAQLVILALPVGSLPAVARQIVPHLQPGAVVTDTGSTKGGLVAILEDIFAARAHYIGGHPMTGSERAGIGAADPYLFENAVYVLTPTPRTNRDALRRLEAVLKALGARILHLSPADHDRIVGAVSHLPHLLAVSLMRVASRLSQEYPELLMFAAGGFRDTTRVAAGNPVMWRDIYLNNSEAVLQVLELWRWEIGVLEDLIRAGEGEGLERALEAARELRAQIPGKQKGLLPALHEIVITVPDKPGIIGFIGQVLGSEGINISDIEILRVREGEGGTIRLGFTDASAAEQALAVLRRHGVTARWRDG
ncbi:prephenate dehydrogenase [Thermanaeromonas sp. C210]|uniref:prephenate dehydrogenase n=1 Tax=Thermanaeromonas sp. C210 TaxID=2731925 RepID=UPI00155BE9FC|nr:prephenate dehydrogenase [Thermanaeromonas sp. C210]GFN23461.1 prephenate dehydrogenase [Thermanaeromonas sp. C210]